MGAWGNGPFENDDAADVLAGMAEAESGQVEQTLRKALGPVLSTNSYLEAPTLSEGIAAACLVSLALQKKDAPENVEEALAKLGTPSKLIINEAWAVLDRAT